MRISDCSSDLCSSDLQVAQPESTEITPIPQRRFAAVVQLLSVEHNLRLRVTCFAIADSLPIVTSVTDLWPGANWFERAAFDLFGIVFQAHPDLPRFLPDYALVGSPFRTYLPLLGHLVVLSATDKNTQGVD